MRIMYKKSDTFLIDVLTLRRNHANLLRILPGFLEGKDQVLAPTFYIQKIFPFIFLNQCGQIRYS